MATPNVSSDMAQFFDFGEAAIPETRQEVVEAVPGALDSGVYCPAHGDNATGSCICHDITFLDNIPIQQHSAEWNSDFSSWLPRYQKPAHPCDYCRSRSLECFIYNANGEKSSACSPCNALFRPCSFKEPEKMQERMSKTSLDTLDIVPEADERRHGGQTGRKPMRSMGHMGPIADDEESDKPKKGASAARFPRAAVKVLKDWMITHIDHPYPTDEDKEILKTQTGLNIGQISNWMANTRRRQKSRPKRNASPSIRPSTEVINIPSGRTWEDLNPFERWKHSPPENEPAPLTAIAQAVETFNPPLSESIPSSSNRKVNSNDSTGSFSIFRAPSTTSLETGFTNMSSGSVQSHGTVWSHGSRNSFSSLNSLNSKKERRRRRRLPTRAPKIDSESAPRLFQCTFCTDKFKSKFDWSRHEKSLHLSLEKWMCAPLGEIITCTASGQRKCVYCDELDPTKDHLETHNHKACEEKGHEARTFFRKDHLRQHLRLMHGCKMTPGMDSWKTEVQLIKSRCGFCGMNFEKWQDRADHLAKEFRNGASMQNWKGCRGLDPHVASHVMNAMPPYLIANESKSPFPFSATNSASMKQHNLYLVQDDLEYLLPPLNTTSPTTGVAASYPMGDVSIDGSSTLSPAGPPNNTPEHTSSASVSPIPHPYATCWEILTLRLGRFARQHMEKYGPNTITDQLLQEESRRILYGTDDAWEQTAADNPEWLNLFKKSHGIQSDWSGNIISHHEIYEDLGVTPGTRLDRSFNLENFQCVNKNLGLSNTEALAYECTLSGTMNVSRVVNALSGSSTPYSLPELGSVSTSCTGHPLPAVFPHMSSLDDPISELMCTVPGGVCIGENGEMGFSVRKGSDICDRKTYFMPTTTSSSLGTNVMAPIREKACTKNEDPIFPTIQEKECTSSGVELFPTIKETPCTKAGERLPSQPSSSFWDQLAMNGGVPSTTAGFSSSLPVTTGFDSFGLSSAEVIQGSIGNPQVMRWDDTDSGFNFDMDMDFDMDLNMASGLDELNQHY
ncbi:hypothetical protein B0J11DRAFT_518746 [Dendryphion nanum]|uniref:Uncharacterized protein n=1 Tax=Dendryphion nanum TaxID=256645 RepID=A0A9P9IVY5_9PLEO|nr:hypothetical protein B0J11DRAFT_518746 [Dendryphion nanum]